MSCSEVAVQSHPFRIMSHENSSGRVLPILKLQTDYLEHPFIFYGFN